MGLGVIDLGVILSSQPSSLDLGRHALGGQLIMKCCKYQICTELHLK